MARSHTIREGPLRLRIVYNPTRRGEKLFKSWEFRWRPFQNGRVERVKRSNRAALIAEAKARLQEHAKGYPERQTLARCYLEDANARTRGYRDHWEEYEALKRLAPAVATTDKKIPDIVAELVAAKRTDKLGAKHVADLESRLGRFAREVKMPLALLSAPLLDQWLRGLPVSNRTRRNYHGALSNFFEFCKTARYLPKNFAEMRDVPRPRDDDAQITLFTPDELRRFLEAASESVLPVILIGAFAGLRQSEILRLDWGQIDFREGHIFVARGKRNRKGKSRSRCAPLLENLRAWLLPLKGTGRVVQIGEDGISKAFARTVERANRTLRAAGRKPNLEWRQNALRHSYVSYRWALEKSSAKVSAETGHSVAILENNYKALVTPDQAREWFSILPDIRPGNSIQTVLELFPMGKTCPKPCPDSAPTAVVN